jgi:hypothetical protein
MAIGQVIDGKKIETLKGRILDKFERNGYDDSDFIAIFWNDALECIDSLEYASTRYHSDSYAVVDADDVIKEKAAKWNENFILNQLILEDTRNAQKVEADKMVRISSGRKNVGTVGKVFWMKEIIQYGKTQYIKIGIALDEEKEDNKYKNVVWTYEKNLKVVNPEEYGKDINYLRKMAKDDRYNWHFSCRTNGYVNML